MIQNKKAVDISIHRFAFKLLNSPGHYEENTKLNLVGRATIILILYGTNGKLSRECMKKHDKKRNLVLYMRECSGNRQVGFSFLNKVAYY